MRGKPFFVLSLAHKFNKNNFISILLMAKVGIIMGSDSDLPIMKEAIDVLQGFDIETEIDIVSAHRTPEKLFDYAKNAHLRGISVIIAGAGGAAHLPGMVASMSPLPIIGVPVKSRNSIDGWDSVLSILQMPGGVPVATVALDGAKNAGILAAQIIGSSDKCILDKVVLYKENLKIKVDKASENLHK
jgi:5-(carboxyamino)imidazole ribonucleotide mutase